MTLNFTKFKGSFSETDYCYSVSYEIAYGYYIVIHIFKDYEYIEFKADNSRGGMSTISTNIDNGAKKCLDIFVDINSKIKSAREESSI
jgi:hypothetical protein